MMKNIFLLLILLCTVSCSGPIPEPTPTLLPTPTPLNIASLVLDSILIQPGDLPAGFSGAQISYDAMPQFLGNYKPIPQNQIRQEFEKDGEMLGGIWLSLYENEVDAKTLFNEFVEGLGDSTTYKLKNGLVIEAAHMSFDMGEYIGMVKTVALTFNKCFYVGYLTIRGIDEEMKMVNYTERLSTRLDELLQCK